MKAFLEVIWALIIVANILLIMYGAAEVKDIIETLKEGIKIKHLFFIPFSIGILIGMVIGLLIRLAIDFYDRHERFFNKKIM